VAYLLPSLTIVIAEMFIGLFLQRRTGHREPVPLTEIPDEDEERLRAEWQKLDEAEGPDW